MMAALAAADSRAFSEPVAGVTDRLVDNIDTIAHILARKQP
jgi:hypothetical protein